ncbi:DUF1351 domain-containing protein [Oscillibacter sp.]|uniref:DUF1351 domain-containing protein n=1 Tax=Oscillibacter sp. TaxID=1945593 RepID=UPI0028968249|nr:DUF1351 domain-containing protein [Oscillibacter sp.]
MSEELIIVKQLPVIEEHLLNLAGKIDQQVEAALSLACTDSTVNDVKKVRADLNKQFAALEEQRRAVKSAVLDPYDKFEQIYGKCVSSKFKMADGSLKRKIDDVEDVLRDQKEANVREYYMEKAASLYISPTEIPFERACIKITLSASEKSLREACDAFLGRIAADLAMIEQHEYRDEILVEFRQSLSGSQAVTAVLNHHRQIEEERKRAAKRTEAEAAAQQHAQEVQAAVAQQEALSAPTETAPQEAPTPVQQEAEPTLKATFTAYGTREQLGGLKNYMKENGIRYE